jgi:hypothetical protein
MRFVSQKTINYRPIPKKALSLQGIGRFFILK